METSSFWDDPSEAQKVISEINVLKEWTLPYYDVKEKFSNVESLYPEAESSGIRALSTIFSKNWTKLKKKSPN